MKMQGKTVVIVYQRRNDPSSSEFDGVIDFETPGGLRVFANEQDGGMFLPWSDILDIRFAASPKRRYTKKAADSDTPKRRGRPPKATSSDTPKRRGRPPKATADATATPKRRGRPPKAAPADGITATPKRRGRPPKAAEDKPRPRKEKILGSLPGRIPPDYKSMANKASMTADLEKKLLTPVPAPEDTDLDALNSTDDDETLD